MKLTKIEEIWNLTVKEGVKSGKNGYHSRMLNLSKKKFHLGYKIPDNLHFFRIQILKKNIPDISKFQISKGIKIFLEKLNNDVGSEISLIFQITNINYKDLFTAITFDIITNIANIQKEKKIIESIQIRFHEWQKFLEKNDPEGLSEKSQRGLYGELYFLKYYVIPIFEEKKASEIWVGPNRKEQDFSYNNCAVEIKTLIGKKHQKVHISSEKQLDDSGLKNGLFLFVISLKELVHGGQTLIELIEEIRITLRTNQIALNEFEKKLLISGYLDVHKKKYQKNGYFILDKFFYKISDGFPRIIEKDLKEGIGDIKYSILLTNCLNFSIKETELVNNLKKL